MHSIAPCNICGGTRFRTGPCERLSNTGRLPRCCACGSLERHRIIHRIFSLVPKELVQGKNALQFSPDESLDKSRFASFAVSEYGGENSLDIQDIALPDASYDWVITNHVINFVPDDLAALREMARVAGRRGIVLLTVGGPTHRFGTTRYNVPTGPHQAFFIYGTDFADRLMEAVPDCAVLEVVATDPATATQDTVYFYSPDWEALRRIAVAAAPANCHARLTPGRAHRADGPEAASGAPAWAALDRELAAWREAGRTPRFWIRDDDANAVHPKLKKLWQVCKDSGAPLCVAAIPAQCGGDLAAWMRDKPGLTVVQHGYDHANRGKNEGGPDAGSSEFPPAFPAKQACRHIRTGQLLLTGLFGDRFAPVFVPPWGTCSEEVVRQLSGLGIQGYSVAGRRGQERLHGLGLANVHVFLPVCAGDSWGVDEDATLVAFAVALRQIRTGGPDAGEAVGLNTHHKGLTERDFDLLRQMIAFTSARGARWVDVREALTPDSRVAGEEGA